MHWVSVDIVAKVFQFSEFYGTPQLRNAQSLLCWIEVGFVVFFVSFVLLLRKNRGTHFSYENYFHRNLDAKKGWRKRIYLLKVNNRNTRTRCEICSKLTIKTPEWRQYRRSGVFIVNFEHISHFVLMFLLLTLNM